MKVDFPCSPGGSASSEPRVSLTVRGETDRLIEVALAAPQYLEAVPCCSVTRESLRKGFQLSRELALQQHQALRAVLAAEGVVCYDLPCSPDTPDQCFVRDVAVTTPWGLVALNPAMPHRRREVESFVAWATQWTGVKVDRITEGTIEGGDICVARSGQLIIGISGERTTDAGARAFAARFIANGWDVLTVHFDPDLLHLDTIFCMVAPDLALACVEVLSAEFIAALTSRGIALLPVPFDQARRLGCNVLSLDHQTLVISSGTPEISNMLRRANIKVLEVDLGQFTACGGGVHCLTMPLRRS